VKHLISKSIEETKKIAEDFVDSISPHEDHATVIGLYGNLGSGKTTFVQNVCHAFGVKGLVTSPTFVIQKTHDTTHRQFKKLFHIDAYRLESGKELLALSWKDTLSNPNNIIFIEWADRVESVLPEYTHKLSFSFVDESTRTIDIELHDDKN